MTVDARFCPRCGGSLPGRPPTRCDFCGYALYVNARPTANVLLVDRDRESFLALRRAIEPRAGLWEIPGGFCDGWEHPREAAVREAREELGVEVAIGDLIGMYVGSYEFQDETLPVLDTFWLAEIVSGDVGIDPAESIEYGWLPLVGHPPLAFATMDAATRDAARRLGLVV